MKNIVFSCSLFVCLASPTLASQGDEVYDMQSLTASGSGKSKSQQLEVQELNARIESIDASDCQVLKGIVAQYWAISEKHSLGFDVHAFNRQFNWPVKIAVLKNLQDRYRPSVHSQSLDDIISEVKLSPEYLDLSNHSQNLLLAGLERLNGYVKRNPVEVKETRVHVPDLVARIWSFIPMLKIVGDEVPFFDKQSAINFLYFSIIDNHIEGGGCYEGFAGRLCRFYLMLFMADFPK